MPELSVATTINARFDHVTPIETAQSNVTITHRCHVFAELMAVARSGLVDVVLIADDFELVRLETLRQVLDAQGQGPKVAAISDVVDDRKRLADLGIPVTSPTLTGPELVDWLRRAHHDLREPSKEPREFSSHDLQVLEHLDPDTQSKPRTGRRAAPYDPTTDLPGVAIPTDGTVRSVVPAEPAELEASAIRDVSSTESGELPVSADPLVGTGETIATVGDRTPGGRLTAVWGPTGAPGVTTVAVNLAVESALAGHRSLLIDADTYGAAVAVHLGLLDDTAAIAQACRAIEHRGITSVELGDYAQHVRVDGARLDVITGLTRSERWPQLRTAAWDQLLETARNGWDHIVIDCGFGLEEDEELSFDIPAPQRNATTLSAVTAADTVIAVGTGDPVGFVRFMRGLDHLSEITAAHVIPVVNKVTAMTSGIAPKRQLIGVWERFGPKLSLQHFVPWAPEVAAAALLEGKALAERAPKADVRYAIRQVLDSCAPSLITTTSSSGSPGRSKKQWSLRHVVTQVKQRAGRGS